MSAFKDITNLKYGKLTAIKPTEKRSSNGNVCWIFKCDCGKTKIADANSVKNGLIKSCGCLFKTHGMTKTRLYKIWINMKQRCNNPNSTKYKCWGGKGVKVCNEWLDFNNFKKWAYENNYNDSLTIDRIDVNGDYAPENCRWATYKEQANNKTDNHFLTMNNETHTIAEWIEILNIVSSATVYRRIREYGWTYEKALLTPPKKGTRKYKKEVMI